MRIDKTSNSTGKLISNMKAGEVFFWDERYFLVLHPSILINSQDIEDESESKTYPVVDLESGILHLFFDDAVQPLPDAILSV